jgi:hypothetical protein
MKNNFEEWNNRNFNTQNFIECISALISLVKKDIQIITTKRIRIENRIQSDNRSKINFIWRCLNFLEENNLIEHFEDRKLKTYLISRQKFNLDTLQPVIIKLIENGRK